MHRQCFDCISVYRALVCVHCYCNASMTGEEEGVLCPGRQSLSPAFITVMNQNSCKFPPSSAHQSSFASVCNKQDPLQPDNTSWCLGCTLWRIHKQLQTRPTHQNTLNGVLSMAGMPPRGVHGLSTSKAVLN